MALMYALGTMNPSWMAAIALWIAAEKSLRRGGLLARLAGIGLTACGCVWLAAASGT
jgi:predicted metal-binding membrane protein